MQGKHTLDEARDVRGLRTAPYGHYSVLPR